MICLSFWMNDIAGSERKQLGNQPGWQCRHLSMHCPIQACKPAVCGKTSSHHLQLHRSPVGCTCADMVYMDAKIGTYLEGILTRALQTPSSLYHYHPSIHAVTAVMRASKAIAVFAQDDAEKATFIGSIIYKVRTDAR